MFVYVSKFLKSYLLIQSKAVDTKITTKAFNDQEEVLADLEWRALRLPKILGSNTSLGLPNALLCTNVCKK